MVKSSQYELNFRDYWRILRKRRLLIVVIFVASVSAAVYQNKKQIPIYEAASKVKLEQRQTVAGALLESSIP
ncbi:MAG: hypothetical protein ABH845_02855, partial [Candidatus Omnitrophota bacterium]